MSKSSMDLHRIAIAIGRILLADHGRKNVVNKTDLDSCSVQCFILHLTHNIKSFSLENEICFGLNTDHKQCLR